MGATWVTLGWLVHHWLFDDAFQALIGSRKEDLVDNGEMDSLFGRIAYIVGRLPAWMLPTGYNHDKHRKYMTLINPASGNAMVGESANQNFARQGRYSVIMLDEFAFWEWARAVWTGTADAGMRVPLSTPNGGNFFKELRFSGRIAVYTLHWRTHPHKGDAWYKIEQGRRTPEDIAQELDISYDKSVQGRVYTEWDLVPKGEFPYVPSWPLYVSWDFGLADNTALIWWARNPATGMWRIVDCYSATGRTIDFYAPFCSGRMLSGLPYGYSEADIAKIEAHACWPAAVHFGDPAGKQRNQISGTSVIDELRKHSIHVNTRPDLNTFEARHHKAKLFLRNVEGVHIGECVALDDAMTNARFPTRNETSQSTAPVSLPIHDWTSHFRTAVEYFAVNAPEMPSPVLAGARRAASAWEGM